MLRDPRRRRTSIERPASVLPNIVRNPGNIIYTFKAINRGFPSQELTKVTLDPRRYCSVNHLDPLFCGYRRSGRGMVGQLSLKGYFLIAGKRGFCECTHLPGGRLVGRFSFLPAGPARMCAAAAFPAASRFPFAGNAASGQSDRTTSLLLFPVKARNSPHGFSTDKTPALRPPGWRSDSRRNH